MDDDQKMRELRAIRQTLTTIAVILTVAGLAVLSVFVFKPMVEQSQAELVHVSCIGVEKGTDSDCP